jgi:hypothetical protein
MPTIVEIFQALTPEKDHKLSDAGMDWVEWTVGGYVSYGFINLAGGIV